MTPATTAYITESDLDTFLGAEKDALFSSSKSISPAQYASAVADINSEIDGYVGYRPLRFIPDALKYHACAVARYRLYRDKASDRIKDENTAANAFFSKIAGGSWGLPFLESTEPHNAGNGGWFSSAPARFNGRAY